MERLLLIGRGITAFVLLACACRAAIAGTPVADAPAPATPRLVIESHAGTRPADTDILLPPVRSMLQTQGHALGDAAIEGAHARLPRRNAPPPPSVIDELGELLDLGFRHWDDVEFSGAIEVLGRAIAIAHDYPRASTESSALRGRLFRAHIVIALAHQRSQKPGLAREAMRALVRGFSDRSIPFGEFGPEPDQLRRTVEAELREQGMARMVVTVREQSARAIFINERFAGAGDQVNVELHPGSYRLFALTSHGPGRIHTLTLSPGEIRHVEIDPGFDRALQLVPQPALIFADEADQRRHEVDYALRLTRAAAVDKGAVLLGIRERTEGRVLYGKTVAPDGTSSYEGFIAIDRGVPVDDLYALGAFLVGAPPSPEVQVVGPLATQDAPARGARFGGWSWVAMGAGAAAVSTGVVLHQLDGRGNCSDDGSQCPRLYDTRGAGITAMAVGTATIAAGTAARIYDARRRRRVSSNLGAAMTPAPHRGFIMSMTGEF